MKNIYSCEYCGKSFTSEKWFAKHKCELMKREEELASLIGMQAYELYKYWMLKKYKNNNVTKRHFMESPYYNGFMRFMEFGKKVELRDFRKYIDFAVKRNILPSIWSRPEIYKLYLEEERKNIDLDEELVKTIQYLYKISDILSIDISEVFDNITENELIAMLEQQKISPWALLHSDKFRNYYSNNLNEEQKRLVDTYMDVKFWSDLMQKNREKALVAHECIKKLRL